MSYFLAVKIISSGWFKSAENYTQKTEPCLRFPHQKPKHSRRTRILNWSTLYRILFFELYVECVRVECLSRWKLHVDRVREIGFGGFPRIGNVGTTVGHVARCHYTSIRNPNDNYKNYTFLYAGNHWKLLRVHSHCLMPQFGLLHQHESTSGRLNLWNFWSSTTFFKVEQLNDEILKHIPHHFEIEQLLQHR